MAIAVYLNLRGLIWMFEYDLCRDALLELDSFFLGLFVTEGMLSV